MRTRSLLIVIVMLLIGAFVALNWPVIMAKAKFNLLVTTVAAPVGMIMLVMVILIVLTFVIYMAVWRSAVLRESRRQAKELQAQRELAERAEASRYTELRGLLHQEFARLDARIAQFGDALRGEIRDNANSIAATIGELDDRIHGHRD